jgi:hypothetical protein
VIWLGVPFIDTVELADAFKDVTDARVGDAASEAFLSRKGYAIVRRTVAKIRARFTDESDRLRREVPMGVVPIHFSYGQLALLVAASSALIVLKSMLVPSVRTTKKHVVLPGWSISHRFSK